MLTLIRTDASSAIGLGHLRRCLSLAAALRALGAEVRFGVRSTDVDAVSMAAAEGFEACTVLPAEPTDGDNSCADAESFSGMWPDAAVDWVVVDHYGLDASWHAQVRQHLHCPIVVIDDLADRPLEADLLVDHNFVPEPGHRVRYAGCLRRPPQAWLCGPRFALLGPAYQSRPAFEVSESVRSIGIFMGGTDPAGLSAEVLRACRAVAGFNGPVEVVSTSANPALAGLQQQVSQDPHARLLVDLPNLADFFRRHDLQIGAGGGATWERCSTGVPALTLCVADNQRAVLAGLQALGALMSASDNSPSAIGHALAALIRSPDRRRELSTRGRALVDGRGAERVALAMAARSPRCLQLRSVTMDDAMRLWQWRNDPATRAVSRSQAEIAWPDHQDWLTHTLADGSHILWLAEVHGQPVGVIRFDAVRDRRQEVSLYLDPGLHGLGLGSAMLNAGEQALARRLGTVTVHAEVLSENPASHRLFAIAGYRAESPFTYAKTVVLRARDGSAQQEFQS